MADVYVNSEELKLIATGMKTKAASIMELYQNDAASAILMGSECLQISGLDTTTLLNAFNKIFTNLNTRINNLADFLSTTVANEYDEVSSAIKNEFDNNFANEIAGILGISVGAGSGTAERPSAGNNSSSTGDISTGSMARPSYGTSDSTESISNSFIGVGKAGKSASSAISDISAKTKKPSTTPSASVVRNNIWSETNKAISNPASSVSNALSGVGKAGKSASSAISDVAAITKKPSTTPSTSVVRNNVWSETSRVTSNPASNVSNSLSGLGNATSSASSAISAASKTMSKSNSSTITNGRVDLMQ